MFMSWLVVPLLCVLDGVIWPDKLGKHRSFLHKNTIQHGIIKMHVVYSSQRVCIQPKILLSKQRS